MSSQERAERAEQLRERSERDEARLAAMCQRTWKVDEPAAVVEARKDQAQTSYRQHRCGELAGHGPGCRCRYCGELR